MSAHLCRQCGGPCEAERQHYATPTCFACLPPPAPLKIIPTREQLIAEIARMTAALEAIAALQVEEPSGRGPGLAVGREEGRWEAAEMARAALVKP